MARPNSSKARSKPNQKKDKGKGKVSFKENPISDIFEADTDGQLARKGHSLDDVEDYEFRTDHVNEEDDEEIDSDEAFNESDEEKYQGFTFAGSTPTEKKQRAINTSDEEQEISLNESNDESDDDFKDAENFYQSDDEKPQSTHKRTVDSLLPSWLDDEKDEEISAGEDIDMGNLGDTSESEEDDDDEDNNEKAAKDLDFIDSLDTKKRKFGNDASARKKVQFGERTEAYQESEFNLSARETLSEEAKKTLDMNDLMGSLGDEASFSSLRKSLLNLDGKGKGLVKEAISSPLARVVQDRLDRQAAYSAAKKEISRWQPTVKENREAEHLSFPMQTLPSEKVTNATLASKFKPLTDMEKQIEEALEQAGMKDEELEAFESLKLNKLSVEEVNKRRNELRLLRELMFRHEIKAKRIKKIKSKSYRKIKREEKKKLIAQAEQVDHDISTEDQLQAATDRAEERMTLRHKNTSKWAKRALARGQNDEGTRDAIMEQLQRGEELRRKIRTMNSDDDSDDGSGGESMDEQEQLESELAAVERDLDQDTQPTKGLFSMKFMQEAAKKELEANRAMVDEFKDEWHNTEDDDNNQSSKTSSTTFTQVQNNPGRMTFGSTKKTPKAVDEADEPETKAHVTFNDAGQIKKVSFSAAHNTLTSGPVSMGNAGKSPLADLNATEGDNPWLQHDTSRIAKKSTKANRAIGKTDNKSEQNIAKIKKTQSGASEQQDEDVELDLSQVLAVKGSKKTALAKGQGVARPAVPAAGVSDDEDEHDTASPVTTTADYSQLELVARAFADDDVVQEFEREKQAIIEEDGDKKEDLTLPGWGRWDGKGIKKKSRNRIIKTIKGVDPKKRKDAKLAHVIVNERKNKKVEKYQTTQVPFPFQNMEQYERSLCTPVGKEWNTRETFQKLTKPRIMTKLGTVIDPLQVPFK